jgi:hypothetical protein
MPKSMRVDPLVRGLEKRRDQLASEIQGIDQAIAALGKGKGRTAASGPGRKKAPKGKRKMSAAGRAAISRAAKKRWAAFRKAKAKK